MIGCEIDPDLNALALNRGASFALQIQPCLRPTEQFRLEKCLHAVNTNTKFPVAYSGQVLQYFSQNNPQKFDELFLESFL